MADITDAQLADVRTEVDPGMADDDAVQEAFDAVGGDTVATILRLLEVYRAKLVASPLSLSIPGQISLSNDGNVRALDDQMTRVRKGSVMTTTTLERPNRSRSPRGGRSDVLM